MLTVSDLMNNKAFSEATIAAGKNGLSNFVLSTGFLEWETPAEITRYFPPGELVITTLAAAKADRKKAENYIKTLIYNNASAIFIKDVYFNEISDELKELADKKCVPVFFFHNVYIDDMIYEVRKQLDISKASVHYDDILDNVFNSISLTDNERVSFISQLNPYFYHKAFLALFISDDGKMLSNRTDSLYKYVQRNREDFFIKNSESLKVVFSTYMYKRGILVLLSFDTYDKDIIKKYEKNLIADLTNDIEFKNIRIGTSYITDKASDISEAVRGAIFANVNCILNCKQYICSDELDSDYSMFSVINSPEIKKYCRNMETLLTQSDSRHISMLGTALTFVKCGGNIEETAKLMFQHKNTIRYRIERIRQIFNAENNIILYGRLYFFTRIYSASPYLKMFFKD